MRSLAGQRWGWMPGQARHDEKPSVAFPILHVISPATL
jgi:hypothetical protein